MQLSQTNISYVKQGVNRQDKEIIYCWVYKYKNTGNYKFSTAYNSTFATWSLLNSAFNKILFFNIEFWKILCMIVNCFT